MEMMVAIVMVVKTIVVVMTEVKMQMMNTTAANGMRCGSRRT
jgi:hypothetical protein